MTTDAAFNNLQRLISQGDSLRAEQAHQTAIATPSSEPRSDSNVVSATEAVSPSAIAEARQQLTKAQTKKPKYTWQQRKQWRYAHRLLPKWDSDQVLTFREFSELRSQQSFSKTSTHAAAYAYYLQELEAGHGSVMTR